MEKEILYYVLKYEDKYYAPYQGKNSYNSGVSGVNYNVENLLSTNKKLAVRFGTKEFAEEMRAQEVMARQMFGDDSFDADKCRVVTVVRKVHSIH